MFILSVVLVTVYIIFFLLPKKDGLSVNKWTDREDQAYTIATVVSPIQENSVHADNEIFFKEGSVVIPSQEKKWAHIVRTQSIKTTSLQQKVRSPTYIVSSQELFNPAYIKLKTTETVVSQLVLPEQILYLEWTHHRVWVMKSAKFIGIDHAVKYILKNNDNTHFAYLGKDLPDIADSLATLWGKSVAITMKNDIHTHWLFGDKIIFLLVPQYIGKKQLFFVYFAEARDRWFIQVDTDIFETTKPLLRELFTKRYNRY